MLALPCQCIATGRDPKNLDAIDLGATLKPVILIPENFYGVRAAENNVDYISQDTSKFSRSCVRTMATLPPTMPGVRFVSSLE